MDNTTKNILKIILKDMVNEIRQNDDLAIEELEAIKRKLDKDINKIIDEMYKIKTTKAPLKFKDAKAEYLQVNNLDVKRFDARYYEYLLKFGDYFLGFEKPSIQTRFCFGYGQNGISTEEDYKDAREQEKNMETNKQTFVNANLEDLNKSIEDIETFIKQWIDKEERYFSSRYNKIFICKNSYNHLAYLAWSWDYDNIRNKDDIIKEATKEDLLLIIEVYKQQIENFKKRLNTYLKRYGLSKLTT